MPSARPSPASRRTRCRDGGAPRPQQSVSTFPSHVGAGCRTVQPIAAGFGHPRTERVEVPPMEVPRCAHTRLNEKHRPTGRGAEQRRARVLRKALNRQGFLRLNPDGMAGDSGRDVPPRHPAQGHVAVAAARSSPTSERTHSPRSCASARRSRCRPHYRHPTPPRSTPATRGRLA